MIRISILPINTSCRVFLWTWQTLCFLESWLKQFINPRSVLSKKNFSFIGNKVGHNVLNSFIQDWNLFINGFVWNGSFQETVSVFAVALLCRTAVNKIVSSQIFKRLFDDDSLDKECWIPESKAKFSLWCKY